MHVKNIDLNLLVIAAALYRHHNVSRAAEELGLSQSAVSHALTRLRDQFSDPLFVRTSRGVAPTEFARKIQNDLLEIIHKAELLASQKTIFNPLESNARVTIASTDYFEILVIPKLLALLEKEAPHLQISLRPTQGILPKKELEEGQIDMAIAGFYRNLPEGFYQTKLFTDQFQCAVGKGHPLFKSNKLSKEIFFSSRHALITLQGDFRDSNSGTNRPSDERKFVYGSYSFTGMAWTLQSSQLILTAPALLLKGYQQYFPLKIWPTPIERRPIDIRIIWHAQTHKDPLRVWLREKLKGICESLHLEKN